MSSRDPDGGAFRISNATSKLLLYYQQYVRDAHAQQYSLRGLVAARFFVRTDTGKGLEPGDLRGLLQKSCQRHVGAGRQPTSLSLRHCFATHYYKEWMAHRIWPHIADVEYFLRKLAFRLNTSAHELRRTYINDGLMAAINSDTVAPFPAYIDL